MLDSENEERRWRIFQFQNIIDKHLNRQKNLFHIFIDFKKAFDYIMMDYGPHCIRLESRIKSFFMIKALYDNSISSFLINNTQGKLFKTSVGDRQYCLLPPILFNVFLEKTMAEIQYNFSPSISIRGIPLWNLKFADDIDLLVDTNDELQELTNLLSNRATIYGMEICGTK